MRFRFTIRDLLWLTALIAMGVGWYIDHFKPFDSEPRVLHAIGTAPDGEAILVPVDQK